MAIELNDENAALIARRFRALSDPTRLRILNHLRTHEEASVGELTEAIGGTQQNISKHLAALNDEGFVSKRKAGTSSLHRIADPGVLELCDQICAGIEARLEQVGAVLAGSKR